MLALYDVKLLDDVEYCHLMAQLREGNNKYRLFITPNLSGIKLSRKLGC